MTYDHDRPTTLEDYKLLCRAGTHHDFAVYVSKVGGGTLGQSYAGYWHYVVVDYQTDSPRWGQIVSEGSDFHSGSRITHREAADEIASFFEVDENGGES